MFTQSRRADITARNWRARQSQMQFLARLGAITHCRVRVHEYVRAAALL
jgi:hypothetical protein